MRTRRMYGWMVLGCLLVVAPTWALPMGTAFTYQGFLEKPAGTPLTDTCDLRFYLLDAPMAGNIVGDSPQVATGVSVASGNFSVEIDFGASAFTGEGRWMTIEVKCTGDGAYVPMTPAVELTPAPHALALPGLSTQQNATSPNILGGYEKNQFATGVVGGTISGGGELLSLGIDPGKNIVDCNFGTVGGGRGNRAAGPQDATVAGGFFNVADGDSSTVGGGAANSAIGPGWSTVGGGIDNLASNTSSTVGGGEQNAASGAHATVCGGNLNIASDAHATVAGGESNVADGPAAFVGGGSANTATGSSSTVAGGSNNTASEIAATVAGGDLNDAGAQYGTIGGGRSNSNINATAATIAGGESNLIDLASWATISGGRNNAIGTGGGSSTIGGGVDNAISGSLATIGGGTLNFASGGTSTIGGGYSNGASGDGATVPGGVENVAAGTASFAAGGLARANHSGAFVWNSSALPFASTGNGQFLINPSGNVGIATNAPSSKLEIAAQDGLAITGFQPFMTLRDTNAANARARIANAGGSFSFFPESFIGGSAPVVISNTGRVGIGDDTPDVALDVVGDIHYTGVITDVSDERLKEDIRPVESALDKVSRLRGVTFAMKGSSAAREAGLIAQDVEAVLPEAVRLVDEAEGHLGVSYAGVTSLLVEAVKEVRAELRDADAMRDIEELRRQVAEKDRDIDRLREEKDHEIEEMRSQLKRLDHAVRMLADERVVVP